MKGVVVETDEGLGNGRDDGWWEAARAGTPAINDGRCSGFNASGIPTFGELSGLDLGTDRVERDRNAVESRARAGPEVVTAPG